MLVSGYVEVILSSRVFDKGIERGEGRMMWDVDGGQGVGEIWMIGEDR